MYVLLYLASTACFFILAFAAIIMAAWFVDWVQALRERRYRRRHGSPKAGEWTEPS